MKPQKETREERFCRLEEARVNKLLQLFRLLGNLSWTGTYAYTRASRSELEFHALQLHASRIFDDALWVDYLQFNQRNRPEVIDPTRLVLVMPDCCKKAGRITRARFEEIREYNCCPHCGRWTQIRLPEEG